MTLQINEKTGYAESPQYPCIKGEGLCKLRTVETDNFDCVFISEKCRCRVLKTAETEIEPKTLL